MTRPNAFVLLILLTLVVAVEATTQPLLAIRTSHAARVNALEYQHADGILFSAGEDGKLLVWQPVRNQLLQSIRVDSLPLRMVRVYPDGDRVAVYASDGRRYRLSVWNWRTGERLFLHTADDEILALTPSPQGSYLLYSTPSIQSVRVLDGTTGRELPFLRTATGIVNYMVVATSEERVMTYTPASGEIVYRAIATGREAGRFTAATGLSDLTLLSSRRYAAAQSIDGQLVIVDLLSGAQVDAANAGEIDAITTDPTNGDVLVLSRGFGGLRQIRRYRFDGTTLTQRFETRREIPDSATAVVPIARGLLAGTREGEILRWSSFESAPTRFARRTVQSVNDLHVTEGRLNMLTSTHVISISSDFLQSDSQQSNSDTTFVRESVIAVNAGAGSQFIEAGPRDLLLWTPSRREAQLGRYALDQAEIEPLDIPIERSLVSVDADAWTVLTVSRAGVVELRDLATGTVRVSYRGAGLQTAITTSRGIFIGKARQGGLDSAIIRLNPDTSETVPMETDSDLVFALHYEPRRGRLFALGVRTNRQGQLSTVVEVFEGLALDRRRTILEIPGEYLGAQLITDPTTGSAYTTLDDRGGVLRWDGIRVTELVRNRAHIPSRIFLEGDYLYTLNRDGSVSVLNRFTGEQLLDVYVAADSDGGWIALRPDGRFFASRDELAREQLLSINSDSRTLRDVQLELEARPVRAPRDDGNDSRFDTGDNPENPNDDPVPFDPFADEVAPAS